MKKIIFVMVLALLFSGCSYKKKEIIIFHAGSLTRIVEDLKDEFERTYPGYRIINEGAGSRACCWKITRLNRHADIFLSADYLVIEDLLFPDYADWYIAFAGNRLVIAYTEQSRYGDVINGDNWYEILTKSDVNFGYSDPNLDPCGYRTIMCWKLADIYYGKKLNGMSIEEALKKNCPDRNIRPGSVQLLALLQNFTLDYAFEYESVAKQHHLKYIKLPEHIDLSNPELRDYYAQVSVRVSGKEKGTYSIIKTTPIVYGGTILKDAENKKGAILFMKFMLSDKGKAIVTRNYQRVLDPFFTNDIERLPIELRGFIE